MKILLTFFVLLFCYPIFADDIRDFQIEGISVGDNVFDYFTKETLNKAVKKFYDIDLYAYDYSDKLKTESLIEATFFHSEFKTYDYVSVTYSADSKKIKKIIGFVNFENEYELCNKTKKNAADEISDFLDVRFKTMLSDKIIHPIDKSGASKLSEVNLVFDSSGMITIRCYDWSNEIERKFEVIDSLAISIDTTKILKINDSPSVVASSGSQQQSIPKYIAKQAPKKGGLLKKY